jgi:capsular polysaccharide biosynthesis protein
MRIRNAVKYCVIAARESLGTYAPEFVRRRLPPLHGQVVSIKDWVAGQSDPAESRATVNYWEPVAPICRVPPTLGYPRLWDEFQTQPPPCNDPLYVVTLGNARVFGRFPCVLSALGHIVVEPSRVHSEAIESHPIYSFALLPKSRRLNGRTLLLASAYGGSFYHWFIDVLPRLDLLRRASIDEKSFDHVLLPESTGPFFEETLQFFPELTGKIKTLSNDTNWECDELVCPSLPHQVGDADSWGPAFVRRRILAQPKPISGSRRLYISRALAGRRRLENESKLYHEVFAPRGFEFIQLERLRLKEQAELFAQASVVAGPHGAGLTNVIYAPEKCKVVELLSEDCAALCYWRLADELKIEYSYVLGTPTASVSTNVGQYRDFSVDETHVELCLRGQEL